MFKPLPLSTRSICALAVLGTVLLGEADLPARETCPVEVKLLLSTQATKTAIGSLGLAKKTAGRVYFYDTDGLDLFRQGVILRAREGADNDFTVKVRQVDGDDASRLRQEFPCEIDRMRESAHVSFSVDSNYKTARAPRTGDEVRKLLSATQGDLLRKAGVSIDWGRIKRVAVIDSMKWTTSARSPYGKLALELWKWPEGEILELSKRAGAEADAAAYSDLERLSEKKELPLSASQDTKTGTVLQSHHASP
jgi:hypothetical protein